MPSSTSLRDVSSAPAATQTEITALRTVLEEDRRARVDQLEAFSTDVAEAFSLGDDARLHVARALGAAAAAALAETTLALSRLDDGTYGVCEHCAEPIPAERLEVLPTSRLCTPCRSRAESRSRGRSTDRG